MTKDEKEQFLRDLLKNSWIDTELKALQAIRREIRKEKTQLAGMLNVRDEAIKRLENGTLSALDFAVLIEKCQAG